MSAIPVVHEHHEPALARSDDADAAHRGDAFDLGPYGREGRLLMLALDELDYGLVLLSRTGRLRFANRSALHKCIPGSGLRLVNEHLHALDERADQQLKRALDGAATGRRSMLNLKGGQDMVSIAVVPMGRDTEIGRGGDAAEGAGHEASALMVFGRRQVCEPLSVEFFAREHGMTLAETAVLRELCQGITPAEVASRSGVALSTVRTHISSLRMKTGARTIGQVMHMLTVLPPIVPVLN
jgi:DNA-binding CsgD family transcriptional regulator